MESKGLARSRALRLKKRNRRGRKIPSGGRGVRKTPKKKGERREDHPARGEKSVARPTLGGDLNLERKRKRTYKKSRKEKRRNHKGEKGEISLLI